MIGSYSENCDLGLEQHFQDLGHIYSLYGPPNRQITYLLTLACWTWGSPLSIFATRDT